VFFAAQSNSGRAGAWPDLATAFEWGCRHHLWLCAYLSSKIWLGEPGTDHFSGCDTPEIGRQLREGQFDVLLVMVGISQILPSGAVCGKAHWTAGHGTRRQPPSDTQNRVVKRVGKSLAYPHFLRLFDAALYVGQRSRGLLRALRFTLSIGLFFFAALCRYSVVLRLKRPTRRETLLARKAHDCARGPGAAVCRQSLFPSSGALDVAAAAAEVRTRGISMWRWMVAGDGELRSELANGGFKRRVCPLHLLGFLQPERKCP